MILFASDWDLYPTAYPDFDTPNKSFVRLSSVYREMGVKNHAFLLALVNPALKGLDPHAPDLTIQEMAAVAVECLINPWYFFREVARVPGDTGGRSNPMDANRGNICLYWSFFNHIMIFLIQIRQTGKSFSTDMLMDYLLNIKCRNTKINLLTKDDTLRRKNIERLKEIAECFPPYLQQRTKGDANNGEEITINSRNNVYTSHVPQAAVKNAYKLGRGLTSEIIHCDEGPYQPNIEIAITSMLGATGNAVDRAKANGTPYGTIFTTTAGKKDDKDGRFIYNTLCEAAIWTEKFFDAKDPEELEYMVRRSSRSGRFMINATFNHRQLGKSDEWLRKTLDATLQSGDDANRDYFNMWTSGNLTNPLSTSLLETITNSHVADYYTEISDPHGYLTRWYIPEEAIEARMRSGKFVMGMDTSEASGGDDISLVLLDVETLEVVAAGTYNETNFITFSEWVCSTLVRYENITAIIERRSSGAQLLDYLLLMLPRHGIDPFRRLFNRVVNDYDEFPDRYREVVQSAGRRNPELYVRFKAAFGFATSGSGLTSRTSLYSTTLQNAAKRSGGLVRDKPLIDQINGLITKNGRIDHEQGEHDDLIIGWLLANWLLTQGKNLAFYGIDVKRIMNNIQTRQSETDEEIYQRLEQEEVRRQIEDLYEKMSNERDDNIARKLEHQLRMLDRKVILTAGEMFSVDELINSVREHKRHTRRIQQPTSGYGYGNNSAQYLAQPGVMSDRPMSASDFSRRY